jgi:hypothetical protein
MHYVKGTDLTTSVDIAAKGLAASKVINEPVQGLQMPVFFWQEYYR